MDKKKSAGGLGLGSVSVVVIFAVLCLTVFAVLSLTTARNGASLAEVSAQAVSDYYEADLRCSEMVQNLVDVLEAGGDVEALTQSLGADSQWVDDALEVSFSQPAGEKQELAVRLRLRAGQELEILTWQIQDAGQWVPDEGLSVWTGE